VIDGGKQQIKEDITIFFIVPTHLYLLWAYTSHWNLPSRSNVSLLKVTTFFNK